MKNGELILFDYKTDHISQEEQENPKRLIENMTKKHGDQLSCYARAAKELFGRAPDRVFIYSIPLGKSIPISTDFERFHA